MKLVVNSDRCEGHARCDAEAPDTFSYDEDGNNISDGLVITAENERAVRRAVIACPERALSLIEE